MDISQIQNLMQSGDLAPKEVAQQVEAMFMEFLIKSMQESVQAEDGLFGDSASSEIYRGMLRQELAVAMSNNLDSPLQYQLEQAMRERSTPPPAPRTEEALPVSGTVPPPAPRTQEALPVSGTVSSPMGWRRDPITGEVRYHRGTDIAAPNGTPIQAVAAGRVVESGPKGGYGNAVVVEADDGRKMLYAHNLSNNVEVGDRVQKGEVIGLVGSTGRSTGPHVHFEVME